MTERRVVWENENETEGFARILGDDIFEIGGKARQISFWISEAPQLINAIAEVCGLSVMVSGEDAGPFDAPVPFSHEGLEERIRTLNNRLGNSVNELVQDDVKLSVRIDNLSETVDELSEKIDKRYSQVCRSLDDHDDRLSDLEKTADLGAPTLESPTLNVGDHFKVNFGIRTREFIVGKYGFLFGESDANY